MGGRPIGITIIALVLVVSGVLQLLIGTEGLGITNFGLGGAVTDAGISGWGSVTSAVLTIIVAGGLFTLAGWAWTLAVVVMGIRILVDLFAILTQGAGSNLGIAAIGNVVVSGIILWYFMRPGVKSAFGR